MSELRYHPFLDTWVITATHRQDRTFLPPADYCPLCPTKPGAFPTEIPFPEYDIVVFENKFPSLSPNPPEPAIQGTDITPVRPSNGVCEVVCYSDDHDATFATMPLSQVRKLTRVWKERYTELAERSDVDYIFIFENKGKEIGVTLFHPHGQIYAYPYVPATMRTMLESEKRYHRETGRNLWSDWLAQELGGEFARQHHRQVVNGLSHSNHEVSYEELPEVPDEFRQDRPKMPWESKEIPEGDRIVWQGEHFAAIVPFFARYPYEVWVVPKRHVGSLKEMSSAELDGLAEILLVVTRKYDKLFGFSMPYIMAMYQEPALPGYEGTRFHVQFFPPYRTETKLKYLAGSEAGAAAFINDTLPEATAKRLRELDASLD